MQKVCSQKLMSIGENEVQENENTIISTDCVPTTNAGEIVLEVTEKVKYGFKSAGRNILITLDLLYLITI